MGVLQGLTSNAGHLYAAWKGEPGDESIYYSRWNGSGTWSPRDTIPGNTSAGPALAVYDGSVFAAWKGEYSDPRLFAAQFNKDKDKWETKPLIPNAYSNTGPALSSLGSQYGGHLVAAWKNAFDQGLYSSLFDGSKWSKAALVGGASSVGPSLATFSDGKVYAIWKGEGSDQGLYYASYDGTKWSSQKPISVSSSVGASLGMLGAQLFAVWKGEGTDETLYYATFDGDTWSGQNPIPASGSSIGAAIAQFNGSLYIMAKGKDADTSLYLTDWDGSIFIDWPAWTKEIPGNSGQDVVKLLAAPSGSYYNYPLADSTGAKLTGTTVTVIVAEDITTDNSNDYSIQVNCISSAQPSGTKTFGWQQYGFRIARDTLFYWVNTFQSDLSSAVNYINWDSRGLPNNSGVVSLPNNTIPVGWQLITQLSTDSSNDKITGVQFSVVEADGTEHSTSVLTLNSFDSKYGSDNQLPILNFQVILVAENESDNGTADSVTFATGKGLFHCLQTKSLVADSPNDQSHESSNIKYSALPASYPNGEFYQLFALSLS